MKFNKLKDTIINTFYGKWRMFKIRAFGKKTTYIELGYKVTNHYYKGCNYITNMKKLPVRQVEQPPTHKEIDCE